VLRDEVVNAMRPFGAVPLGRGRHCLPTGTRDILWIAMRPAGVLGIVAVVALVTSAAAGPSLVALDERGTFLVFDAEHPDATRRVTPDVPAGLIGIDVRPADSRLYGVSLTNDLYRIDPATGSAQLVATLTVPFDGGLASGVDFNPQADRLRLVSTRGQN